MAIDTYDKLKVAILEWLGRVEDPEDPVGIVVETLISLAETRMWRELRVRELIERVSAPIDEAQEKMPARFLVPVSASITTSTGATYPLKYVTAHELYRGSRNVEGTPCLYTIVGGEILFAPKIVFDADADVDTLPTMELIGYFSPEELSVGNETNDILRHYPNLYLYASLLEATAFLTSDQLVTWAGAYAEALDKANMAGQESMFESVAQELPPGYAVIG